MIKVESFCDSSNNANTYLIESDNHLLIIDPANNIKTLSGFIGNRKVDAILLTHGHYDHFCKLEDIMKLYPVKCYLHPKAIDKLFDLSLSCAKLFGVNQLPKIDIDNLVKINDNEQIKLGKFNVKALYTPGHTNCSVVYIIDDLIFTGDTLFKQSIGRTDLPTGSIISLNNSLKRIKKLNKEYIIYPGHDEKTTLSSELNNNYYIAKL